MSRLVTIKAPSHETLAELAAAVDRSFSKNLAHEEIPIKCISEETIHRQAAVMRDFICKYIDAKEKMQVDFIRSLNEK